MSVCANVQYGNVTIMKVCEKKMFSMRDRQSEGLCGQIFHMEIIQFEGL